MEKMILLGGRTGGPIIPLLAVSNYLPNYSTIIFGVTGGFEDKVAERNKTPFYSFPETKLNIRSYSNTTLVEKFHLYLESILMVFFLFYSFVLSLYRLVRIKPNILISCGSFLGIPVIFSAKLLNSLKITNTVIVIHQQDPLPALTNKVTARFADHLSCVFPSTKKYPEFKKATIISNPFDYNAYSKDNIEILETQLLSQNNPLSIFIKNCAKPILLVFGGGSGSEFINNWVIDNKQIFTSRFDVIHITGTHRNQKQTTEKHYISIPYVIEEMRLLLAKSELIISRCGMGTITELIALNKPAYLIPLPHTHQEINASEVKDRFYILHQESSQNWIEIINQTYPAWFDNKLDLNTASMQKELIDYFSTIAA